MTRKIDLPFEEIHREYEISSSHWRNLKIRANNSKDRQLTHADVFDNLIDEYVRNKKIKKEAEARREPPIPASEYDGEVLTEHEWQMMIYDYIPIALKNIFKKKYYLKNMSKVGPMEYLHSDVFMQIAVRVRPRSGKTMYQKYLDNVNYIKSWKLMVYRAAENLIRDRITVGANTIPLDTLVYSGDSEVTIGDLIKSERDEHSEIYIRELMDRCKEVEIGGICLYSIAKRLMEDVNEQGRPLKLTEVCKEYGLNTKKVRALFETIGVREIIG